MNIIWDMGIVTNNGEKFLNLSDPCYNIGLEMSRLLKEQGHDMTLMMPLGCEFYPEDEFNIITYKAPIHYAYSRFHFDFTEHYKIFKQYKIDLIITDRNTLVVNYRALFDSIGYQPKIITLSPYVDTPGSRKVPEHMSYYPRQFESFGLADACIWQSDFNYDEYMRWNHGPFDPDKHFIVPWGYSQKEIDGHKTKKNSNPLVPIFYFTNRITDNADRYTNWHVFAEAIGKCNQKDAALFIFRNPTRKITESQLKEINEKSRGFATIIPNDAGSTDRNNYLEFINGAHFTVNLFNKAHYGMSQTEGMAMGNLPIVTNINATIDQFNNWQDYPLLISNVNKEGVDSDEVARKLDTAIGLFNNEPDKYIEYSERISQMVRKESYEQVINDLNKAIDYATMGR